jgi:SSS family solute:Na+ symporter/sodium/pantothenate symporter
VPSIVASCSGLIAANPSPLTTPSPYVLVAFAAYMAGVLLLGALSHQLLERGSFLKAYFLGDRKLNAWVLSLTYVATSVSAGSFVGFPSLIYTHGWVMALWIGGYMIGGLTSKGVLAKRLNQVSRFSGAITVPDVLRDRFQSPALGLLASIFLLLFLVFNLVGQFKAGGLIMRQACGGVQDMSAYQTARGAAATTLSALHLWNENAAKATSGSLYDLRYPDYVLGIVIFALTVVAYTTYGGFWAVTWTDVLQGLVIVAGAMLLMVFALGRVGGLGEATTRLRQIDPDLITGPGPGRFLPPGLAVSFFFLWTIGAMGQPVGMVRLMACRDTPTLRTSLFMIGVYYALIYLPLVVTFVCARALYPTEYLREPDNIMPAMALAVTGDWPILGGLILAAPYAAAMSAVAGFLLLISSSLVRDIYQRNINPFVSQRGVRWVSYGTTAIVGLIVTAAALRPPRFLQYIIVFTTSGMACTFLAATVLALYWRRATRAGALAAAIGGFSSVLLLYVLGWLGAGKPSAQENASVFLAPLAASDPATALTLGAAARQLERVGPAAEPFAPLYLFGLDPLIYGLAASFGLGIGVSLVSKRMPEAAVEPYFLAIEGNWQRGARPQREGAKENGTNG